MIYSKHGKAKCEWKDRKEMIGDVYCVLRMARLYAHCDSKTLHGLVEASKVSVKEFVEKITGEENECE